MTIYNSIARGLALSAFTSALFLTAGPSNALIHGSYPGSPFSQKFFDECVATNGSGILTQFQCSQAAVIYDPVADGINSIHFEVQFDASLFTFNEAESGPLGMFSNGGDAPVAGPGIGTEALQLLPSAGFNAGAPLPGSTLAYSVIGNVVSVQYDLADPVSSPTDINFFRLTFTRLNPISIYALQSTVTYGDSGVGTFTQMASSCTSTGIEKCASANPSTTITPNYSYVPEPANWAMLITGFSLTGAMMRRRRTVTVPA